MTEWVLSVISYNGFGFINLFRNRRVIEDDAWHICCDVMLLTLLAGMVRSALLLESALRSESQAP